MVHECQAGTSSDYIIITIYNNMMCSETISNYTTKTTTREANNNNKNILSFICWQVRFHATTFQKIRNTIDIALGGII